MSVAAAMGIGPPIARHYPIISCDSRKNATPWGSRNHSKRFFMLYFYFYCVVNSICRLMSSTHFDQTFSANIVNKCRIVTNSGVMHLIFRELQCLLERRSTSRWLQNYTSTGSCRKSCGSRASYWVGEINRHRSARWRQTVQNGKKCHGPNIVTLWHVWKRTTFKRQDY